MTKNSQVLLERASTFCTVDQNTPVMPRIEYPSLLFENWPVTIGGDGRLEILSDSFRALVLAASAGGEDPFLLCVLGRRRQLRVVPANSELAKLHQTGPIPMPGDWELPEEAFADALRIVGALFRLKVHVKGRPGIRIAIPKELQKLGLLRLPADGPPAVVQVVVAGPLIEFWSPEEWLTHLAALSGRESEHSSAVAAWLAGK